MVAPVERPDETALYEFVGRIVALATPSASCALDAVGYTLDGRPAAFVISVDHDFIRDSLEILLNGVPTSIFLPMDRMRKLHQSSPSAGIALVPELSRRIVEWIQANYADLPEPRPPSDLHGLFRQSG